MLLDTGTPSVGMVADLLDYRPPTYDHEFHTYTFSLRPEPDEPTYEMVLATKRARDLSRRVSAFDPEDLPTDIACLDMLEVLVISSDRIATDTAGIAMIRDWVLRGGHLWFTLEEVQPETVSAVLGDAYHCTRVDRVELNDVAVREGPNDTQSAELESFEVEVPVPLVRMLVEDVTVTHTVNGWPAAFWQPFGSGRVYFTTLGPLAWMRRTASTDPPAAGREFDTPFYPRRALDGFANDCLVPNQTSRLEPANLRPFLSQQIGYRILNRGTVLTILLAFCLGLGLLGWSSFRARRPERVLWGTPAWACAVALVFLAIGTFTKKSVPPTVATIGHVQLEPGVNTGHASGLIAIYNQNASKETLGAQAGGMFFPDMTAMSGRNRRITWTDEGKWYWEELELPPGVRTAPFACPVSLNEAVSCQASFGPSGLRGAIGPLPVGGLGDAVIAVPHQNAMAPLMAEDGTFSAGRDDVLARGEYLRGALVSDQQVRRKAIYVDLLDAKMEYDVHPRPLLYVWAEPFENEFVFPQQNQLESTLISMPLRLQTTPPGTQVQIPSPFVPYRAVMGPSGKRPVAYTNISRQWIDCKLATTEWLRFQLPSTVLPLELQEVDLQISLRAPSRTVELVAPDGDSEQVVLKLKHPIGSYRCTIDKAELLQLDNQGGLQLAVRVGKDESSEPGDQMRQAEWLIEEIRMHVTGTVRGTEE
jgi:hypothetical protein